VTTATKTRPRKTKKKAAKKATSRRGGKGKTKKPKWSAITFKQIESWRVKLGLSKSGMAEALQVTNSTYHNWRRGTTVPHPNQQEEILQRIKALETNSVSSSGKGKSGGAAKKRKTTKTTKTTTPRGGSKNGGGRNRLGDYLNEADADSGSSNGSRATHQGVVTPVSLSGSDNVPREDIAAITVAFIQAQKKAVSAGSVVGFVKSLREVM
jgi:DNA-binding transcriptional regulator YiaG